MQNRPRQRGTRARLQALLEESSRYGGVSTQSVRKLATDADLSYTTLARYLLYDPPERTETLRRSSLTSIAHALDVNPNWLRDGQGSRQLALWPVAVRDVEPDDEVDPLSELRRAIDSLADLSADVRLAASRAGINAILRTVVERGAEPKDDVYEALLRVDASHRGLGEYEEAG